ncbi:tigger transposable element-derived protein 6-like isoform X2 [Periplaneta americana]|uniref:tigger transposable element-derived protein 6-like isoform X2 n=1 Tax=Periplaneta americana TaxID=6978 RepID=UPI0037E8E7CA
MNGNSNLGIKEVKEELECPETPVNEENPAKASPNKRVFTLNEKAALINCSENEGLSVRELTEKFKCGKTSVYEILKRKSEILEQCVLGAGSRKRRLRKTGNEDINKAVWQWFLEAKSNNFSITGRVLQAQAKLAAERLGRPDFKASNGWLESFRSRHAINFKQPTAGSSQEQPMNQDEWNSYNEMDALIEVKEEQEDTDPGFELQDTETIDLLSSSSPLPSRGDGESDSSYPTTTNISGSLGLPPTRSQPMAFCENSPDPLPELPKQHSLDAEQHEEERTLETLQLSEQERQRRLEILEKEHDMKMDILRIEKETAEINRDIARRQHLWQSENQFYSTSQLGDLGSGAGKGGGGGGSIREAGGAFGKMEAAREEEYFYKQILSC